MAFYCNGKKGVCDTYPVCKRSCEYFDGSGGKHIADLGGKRITTNADRIRATDDELATMLHAAKLGYAPWCDYHCENQGDDGCDNCIKKWLKQPAEKEEIPQGDK